VAGINGVLSNFNTSAGVAGPFVNGASVTFDDKVANGGHNGGVFSLNLSTAAGVYPSSVNISGGTAYTFSGIGGIHGIGGLNLLGTSSLTLANASNTYGGLTNISSGTLIAGATNVLSPNSPVLITGGTLDASGFNNSIPSLNISSGTLKLGASTVLTDIGTATFAGALNLVGTPAALPDILMTYTSETGAFATNNLPVGEGLSYSGGNLEVVAVVTGPSNLIWANTTGNGLWDTTSANWNNSSATVAYSDTSNPSLSAGDNVSFTDSNGGGSSYNVSITATVHPTSVTVTTNNAYTFNGSGGIAGPGGLTLSGSGSLTLNETNTYTGATNVTSGTLILGTVGALPSGTALIIGSGASVIANNLSTGLTVSSLSNLGKLDLSNNSLTITTASLATISSELAAGYNGGAWNGSGAVPEIVSSAAANDTTHLTALGVMQNGTGVLVKYTYYGDADLNGHVDGSDYSIIDNSALQEAGTGMPISGWANGDFNYDGVVDGSDYTLIDNAYNTQGAELAAAEVASTTAQIAGLGATSAVPEPATLGLLGIGVLGILGRRNRRHR
jgi:autotransporter-associated beta strand protein